MIDYFPGDPVLPSPEMLLRPTLNLTIAVALSAVAIALLARYFPSLPLFRRLMLPAASAVGPSLAVETAERPKIWPGMTGSARTILRPAGRAEINGAMVDVVTEGEFIDAGAPVRVVEVTGSRVVVKRS